MSSWNYRVLRHQDGSLAVHEVYYDDDGQPKGCTAEPVSFGADEDEGLDGIITSLERALANARDKPILDLSAFASPDHPSAPAATDPVQRT